MRSLKKGLFRKFAVGARRGSSITTCPPSADCFSPSHCPFFDPPSTRVRGPPPPPPRRPSLPTRLRCQPPQSPTAGPPFRPPPLPPTAAGAGPCAEGAGRHGAAGSAATHAWHPAVVRSRPARACTHAHEYSAPSLCAHCAGDDTLPRESPCAGSCSYCARDLYAHTHAYEGALQSKLRTVLARISLANLAQSLLVACSA